MVEGKLISTDLPQRQGADQMGARRGILPKLELLTTTREIVPREVGQDPLRRPDGGTSRVVGARPPVPRQGRFRSDVGGCRVP